MRRQGIDWDLGSGMIQIFAGRLVGINAVNLAKKSKGGSYYCTFDLEYLVGH
jgi:hypothetical protein